MCFIVSSVGRRILTPTSAWAPSSAPHAEADQTFHTHTLFFVIPQVENYWEASKKMLIEDDFLGTLKRYDKDRMDPAVVKRVQAYVANPEFSPDKIQQASCCWRWGVVQRDSYRHYG